ncbi:histidine kinase [Stutzerimonas zhaodongensis]|uniref:histidine kinase n=1 Tax=Stutzerimonas zhaodongensis TaxID=1176257 RepID=A0A365PSU5_9GAMM|nr:response regulator [Stutzerimonas zhaodongensis]RBA56597.1 histidine kinase [Stutzerimonas zhaodongensis]
MLASCCGGPTVGSCAIQHSIAFSLVAGLSIDSPSRRLSAKRTRRETSPAPYYRKSTDVTADISSEARRLLIGTGCGVDFSRLVQLLDEEGYELAFCSDSESLFQQLDHRVGAVIATDRFLASAMASGPALTEQGDGADIPFIVVTDTQSESRADFLAVKRRLPEWVADLVILEQPIRPAALLSTVAMAWRSRLRQFEIADRLVELAEQQATLESLVEHLPVGICLIATNGTTVLSNPTYERYVPNRRIPSTDGRHAQRWVGLDSQGQRIPPDQFAGARALRGEMVEGADFRYYPDDGPELWTRVNAVPLYDSQGEIRGAALVVIDINAEKQNEEMLRRFNDDLEFQVKARTRALEEALEKLTLESQERARTEDQLRQSMKMDAVGQLTGGIAHDFNNMLTGVIGALDLMRLRIGRQQYGDLDRYMTAAHTSASRAAALTQRLLAFSRRQSLEARTVSVNPLILSLSDLLKRTLTERIKLELQLDDRAGLALVDPNQLENALLNLSINARDAMPDGGILAIATSRADIDETEAARLGGQRGRYVSIRVSDTGVGIPEPVLGKIFEPFFTTKPLGQGTGLGLSMVYGFVQQSSGFVSVTSEEGAGTSITLYIPLAQSSAVENGAIAASVDLTSGRGQTILVVEDDDSVRLLLAAALEDFGYQVHLAEEGQQALSLLDGLRTLDLLITDVGLPGLNGRQLAEIIQQKRPDLPVLFISGYAENAAIRSEFLGTGMSMMTKPFTLEHLAETVSAALDAQAETGAI